MISEMGCVNSQFVKVDPDQEPKVPNIVEALKAKFGSGSKEGLEPALKAKELAQGIAQCKKGFEGLRSGTYEMHFQAW